MLLARSSPCLGVCLRNAQHVGSLSPFLASVVVFSCFCGCYLANYLTWCGMGSFPMWGRVVLCCGTYCYKQMGESGNSELWIHLMHMDGNRISRCRS